MPTLQDIADHLQGLVSVLSPTFARDIVNQARESLYDEREWGFLWTEGVLRIPALISSGMVSVTRYSKNVTLSVSAKAAVDALGIDDIDIKGRQFKTRNFEIEYTIDDYDSTTGILTLDEMYLGATDTSANYQIYKRYYYPPSYIKSDGSSIIDFGRFEAIIDPKNQWQLNTSFSNSWLNNFDVNRQIEGNPSIIVPHKEKPISNNESVMTYELYPVLKDREDKILKVLYIRKGYNMNPNEKFPSIFSKKLLIAAAKIAFFEWCNINKGKFPDLQKTNWENMIALTASKANPDSYTNLLDKAFKRDEEAFPQALQSSYSNYSLAPTSLELTGEYYGMNETIVTSDGVGRFRF